MPIPLGLAMLGSAALGIGGGLISNELNQQQQLEQQQKLIEQQTKAQKELGTFNQELAMKTWMETNYPAQVEQMKKAGLNVGLMYKGAGAGGTTQGGQAGNVTGGQANPNIGMGLQLGLQAAMQQAQIDNLNANTEKTKVETAKTQGVDTAKVGAETAKAGAEQQNIAQETINKQTQNTIMQIEKQMKEQQNRILQETGNDQIATIRAIMDSEIGKAKSAEAQGTIDASAVNQRITQIQQTTIEQGIRINAMKEGIKLTQEQQTQIAKATQKIGAEIMNIYAGKEQEWQRLSIEQRKTIVAETLAKNAQLQTEFNTSTGANIRQWTGIIADLIPLAGRQN